MRLRTVLAAAAIATSAAATQMPHAASAASDDDRCYEQVELEERRYAHTPITFKRGKQVQGAQYVDGSWIDGEAEEWYEVPESLQPPHENTIPPTGNVGPGTYGLHRSVPYRYAEWSVTGYTEWYPSEDGWTTDVKDAPWVEVDSRTVVVDGPEVDCPPPPPDPCPYDPQLTVDDEDCDPTEVPPSIPTSSSTTTTGPETTTTDARTTTAAPSSTSTTEPLIAGSSTTSTPPASSSPSTTTGPTTDTLPATGADAALTFAPWAILVTVIGLSLSAVAARRH